ncbi:MAG: hypothetical protein QOI54_1746 [Actinomycetota bacterium]|nr:hypothetical protein [Actinomycetota bacterium]
MTQPTPQQPPGPHEGAPPEPAPEVADPRVGAAVRRLDELADLPPAEHVEIYESVHRGLQQALAEAAGDDPASDAAPDATWQHDQRGHGSASP